MILIGQYDSPFVRRVAVTLHHYHMPFTRKPLSVFADKKEVQALSPLIRVPILVLENGETLVDSVAILDHLDEVAGHARALTPVHGPERRRILQVTVLATGLCDKILALMFERTNHEADQVAKRFETRLLSQINAALAKLEHDCGSPWFFDGKITQADVTTGCMISFLKLRNPELFPADKYPKLHALSRHCEMREEFDAARIGSNETAPSKL